MADCIDTKSTSPLPARAVAAVTLTARAGARLDVFGLLMTWHERARQRRALGTLDQRLLRDIGLDPATAATEASKPFWRE